MLRYGRDLPQTFPPIAAPTLLIWGVHDPFLGIGLTHNLERWVPDLRIERIRDASHWVQNEIPEKVNRLLVEFLRPLDG
jgi:pimeloyl-ACP methyl ester carboxylesterase